MNPAITHILAGPITEKEHTEFQRYGNLTFVLRIEWLIDSVLICKRMNEEDYFIRSYKLPEASLADDRSIGMSQSLPNFIRLDSFKSISGVGTYNRP